ncbi:MAG TPA: BamA/TamA family outer membrane protein [Thermoanaerobaculia bacterium]|nr:BamA/TamA family outer membrane protein [Thermoanaerobaculia bacterium]
MSRSFHPRRAALPLAVALAALIYLPQSLSAQYFGRNKVVYEQFKWQVLKTEHFDIHYYPEEEAAVREAARMAERWYSRLSSVFGREFTERKSLILYADQADFQQTTVSRGLIGEGTGGFTEGLRTRVVLPFTGNFADTDHVLGHELVHVFQYDILQERRGREQGSVRSSGPVDLPLWFIEGMAEYLSLGRFAPQTAMYLRDGLARDALPDLNKLSRDPRYFPYRWGHAFWAYVGGRWGDLVVGRLFARAARVGLEPAFQEVLATDLKQFSEDWKAAIRQAYGPVIENRQTPAVLGKRLLPREDKTIDTYVSPVLSPDGSQFAVFSTRSLFSFDLYLADAKTGQITGKLFSADADAHLDSLRFLDSAGTWSPDGARFALVVQTQGDNELAILDVRSRRIERRIGVPEAGQLWNPAWSPDGRSIAVSGSVGGWTDLFLIDVESGSSRRLTSDGYAELQPEWSPDSRSLAYVSDRGTGGDPGNRGDLGDKYGDIGIWLMEVAGGQTRQIVAPMPNSTQFNPRFAPGGQDLYFLSDRAGVSDLYRLSLGSGELFRVTRAATGVAGITRLSPALSVSPRTGDILISVFNEDRHEVHSLEAGAARGEPVVAARDEAAEARAALLPPQQPTTRGLVSEYLQNRELPAEPGGQDPAVQAYRRGFKLDWIGPSIGVGYSSTYGTGVGGDIAALFSDELGQQEIGVAIQGETGQINEFGFQGYYLNQARRLQWGGSASHLPYISGFTTISDGVVDTENGQLPATFIQQVRQTITEDRVSLISQYPLSLTQRFEASAGVTRIGFDNELFQVTVVGDQIIDRSDRGLPAPEALQLYQATLAFVGDSSYFGFTAPVRGRRYRVEVEPTFGDLEFEALTADYRRYFFFRPVTLAMRGLHFGRYGRDAESERLSSLYLGRPTLVRGYEFGDIGLSDCTPVPGDPSACPEFDRLIGSRIAVANLELRLPLLGVEGYGLIRARFLPTDLSFFVDAGTAWTKDSTPELRFDRDTIDRVPVVSAGVSARVLLGGFAVLEFYYAKPFQRPNESWVTGFLIAPGW